MRLIKSGISETIIGQQVKQSGQGYNLTVGDLLYLKENGAQETMIAALMATHAAAPAVEGATPTDLVFDDLILVGRTFMTKDRPGRLVAR